MRKPLFAIVLAAFFALQLHAQDAAKEQTRKLPAIDIKTTEFKNINTGTFDNGDKPLVICFWATWCKPCVEELNAIGEHYEDWQKETGMKVIAISLDDARTMNRVGPFVNGKGWEYEVYVDPNGDFKRAMNVNNPPQSFVLSKDNDILWSHVSYAPGDELKLHEIVQKVAEGKSVKE